MKRIISLLTVMAIMAAMVAASAMPASAQAGCQGFGKFIAAGAPHGEAASGAAPINEAVVEAAKCQLEE